MAVQKKLLTTQHVPMRQIGAGDGNQTAYDKGYKSIDWGNKGDKVQEEKQLELGL